MKALSHTVMYCKYLKFYTLSLIWEILELFEHVYVVIIRYLTSYSVGSLLKFSCWCINQLLFLLNRSFGFFFGILMQPNQVHLGKLLFSKESSREDTWLDEIVCTENATEFLWKLSSFRFLYWYLCPQETPGLGSGALLLPGIGIGTLEHGETINI